MADDLRFQTMEPVADADSVGAIINDAAEADKAAKMKKRRKWALYGVAGILAKVALGFGIHYALVGSH